MNVRNLEFGLSCLVIVLLMSIPSPAQFVPAGFAVENLVLTNLTAPNDFCFLADGRILIAERGGQIKLKRPGIPGVTTIGTVTNVLLDHAERGVLSIANRGDKLYVWAGRTNSPSMVLSRFTLTGDLNDAKSATLAFSSASEYVIVNNVPDATHLHNGGTLRFGPDGMLYLSVGDDGACDKAALFTKMAGVILRMDVAGLPASGSVPPIGSLAPFDNPFVSAVDPNQRVVIAKGLRSPFSMCIDQVSGDLFIADVGQESREELNWFPRNLGQAITPRSYGWPWFEGTLPFATCTAAGSDPGGHTGPIDERTWGTEGFAIICAGVSRNVGGKYDFGPAYEFNVFHNGFYFGSIKRLLLNPANGQWVHAPAVPGQPDPIYWGTGFFGAMHFDLGPDGAIYFVQRAFTGGALKRIRGSGQVYKMAILGGNDQVCTSGSTFGQTLQIRVRDKNNQALAGVTVDFESEDGSAAFAPNSNVTNAQGLINMTVSSTGLGDGPVLARASLLGAKSIDFDLFARKLEVKYTAGPTTDTLQVDFHNLSKQKSPSLPLIFAVSGNSQPVYNTFFGDLFIDLITLQNTYVLEDSTGFFGGVSYGPVPPFGTPSWSTTYNSPANLFSGATVRFQLITIDASIIVSEKGIAPTDFGRSNPVYLTFP